MCVTETNFKWQVCLKQLEKCFEHNGHKATITDIINVSSDFFFVFVYPTLSENKI